MARDDFNSIQDVMRIAFENAEAVAIAASIEEKNAEGIKAVFNMELLLNDESKIPTKAALYVDYLIKSYGITAFTMIQAQKGIFRLDEAYNELVENRCLIALLTATAASCQLDLGKVAKLAFDLSTMPSSPVFAAAKSKK